MATRRLALSALAVGGLLAATALPASAAPKEDSVTGGGRDASGAQASINARSGPLGQNASGHINATNPQGLRTRLDVVCLTVSGEAAAIGAVVTQSSDTALVPVGSELIIVVNDGRQVTDDRLDFHFADAENCSDWLGEAKNVFGGNLRVYDALK